MLRIFLLFTFSVGFGANSPPSSGALKPEASAQQRVIAADSIRIGIIFPGGAGLYAGRVTRRIRLGEKKVVMSDVASVAFPGNGHFFAVSRQVSRIVLYDTTGRQVRAISRWGSRRLEYDRPTVARAFGDSVAVWDGGNMKYLYFDGDGEPLSETSGFTWETSDFLFKKDRILGYRAGDNQSEFLYEYDIARNRIELSGDRGGVPVSGAETWENNLLAGDPDSYAYILAGSCLMRLVERSEQTKEVDICDAGSRPVGIHRLENRFVLVSYVEYEGAGVRAERSHVRLNVLDRNLHSLDVIEILEDEFVSTGTRIVGSHGNHLYFIHEMSSEDSVYTVSPPASQKELIELTLERTGK